MSKLFQYLIPCGLAFAITTATAQPFMNPPSTSTTPTIQMTPQEFKARVEDINKRNRERFKQEREQDIANAPPLNVPTTAPTEESAAKQAMDKAKGTPGSQAQTTTTPASAAPKQNTAETTAPPPASPTPAQSDVYTGYQSGNSGGNNAPAKPSSGWGIKY